MNFDGKVWARADGPPPEVDVDGHIESLEVKIEATSMTLKYRTYLKRPTFAEVMARFKELEAKRELEISDSE